MIGSLRVCLGCSVAMPYYSRTSSAEESQIIRRSILYSIINFYVFQVYLCPVVTNDDIYNDNDNANTLHLLLSLSH